MRPAAIGIPTLPRLCENFGHSVSASVVGCALAAQLAVGEQTVVRRARNLQSENATTPSFHTVCPAQAYTERWLNDETMNANPRREVHCAEAVAWMTGRSQIPGTCAITSLPDVSEVGLSLPAWREWFMDTTRRVVDSVPEESVSVFFQSDIKRDGRWIDKGALVIRAAEDAGAHVLFHKIICRRPPGQLTLGRPGYTHMIAVSRAMKCPDAVPIADVVLDAGRQTWVRAMGIRAAAHAVRFVRDYAGASTIFDPFCGIGTVLAVANALGLDALGVEMSRKRSEQARVLKVLTIEL